MPSYLVSAHAYSQVVLHAARNSTVAVNGLLLGRTFSKNGELKTLEVLSAQPLLHGQLGLAPMLEVALQQVEAHLTADEEPGEEKIRLQIVGYYHSNALVDDNDVGVVASRVADRVQDHYPHAILLMMDNAALGKSTRSNAAAVNVWERPGGKGPWTPTESSRLQLEDGIKTLNRVALKLADPEQSTRHLHDFEDHLNDPSRSWLAPAVATEPARQREPNADAPA